jgi:hypothetical protein
MIGELQLRGDRIQEFALACLDRIGPAPSKIEALRAIADYAAPHIEEYRLYALQSPDDISLNFIELLDQVIFELSENMPADVTVREYLTDDLFTRLSVYLDIFRGRDSYTCNLNRRLLTHEDAIVIRQCQMAEHIPLLMSEYYEQPVLQRSILHALLSFDSDELLNFYYNIAKEGNSIEVKALSLVGLKKFGSKFRHWRNLASEDDGEFGQMIAYAQSFDCDTVEINDIPANLSSLLFVVQYIETNRDLLNNPRGLKWVLCVLRSLLGVGYYNSYLADIYLSICTFIIFAGIDSLKQALSCDEDVKALVQVVDFLPREYFDRVVPKLAILGDEFIKRVNAMLAAGKIKLDDRESNVICYLLWKSGNSL